jgi:hypothetical protein
MFFLKIKSKFLMFRLTKQICKIPFEKNTQDAGLKLEQAMS